MKEGTQDQFLNSIVEALIHNLAYYLPKEIIPTITLAELKGKISPKFFNDLSILDIYQGIGEFEVIEFNERLAKKRQRLEKTIFELIKKRKELEEDEFEYILDKYFRQVEFYLAITNWLRLNVVNYKSISKQFGLAAKGSFEFQYEAYNIHFNELINYFYKGKELNIKESFTVEEILKNYLQDLITRLKHVEEVQKANELAKENQNKQFENTIVIRQSALNSQTGSTVSNRDQQTAIKKKKRPMVTDKEAQDFLLTSVFKIDPKIIIEQN